MLPVTSSPAGTFLVSGFPFGTDEALSDEARLCYHSITGNLTDNATVLTNVSQAIASRTQVFSNPLEGGEVVLIWPNELMEGALRLGGAYLEFPDARPTLIGNKL